MTMKEAAQVFEKQFGTAPTVVSLGYRMTKNLGVSGLSIIAQMDSLNKWTIYMHSPLRGDFLSVQWEDGSSLEDSIKAFKSCLRDMAPALAQFPKLYARSER